MEWQPIETAPKDGTLIIGAWQCLNRTWDMNCMFWFEEEGVWWDYHAEHTHTPTCWVHLPESPRGSDWKCPINFPGCTKNCGDYGCGN
jgi:hypothetical protein